MADERQPQEQRWPAVCATKVKRVVGFHVVLEPEGDTHKAASSLKRSLVSIDNRAGPRLGTRGVASSLVKAICNWVKKGR
jgi:hypothetical protein